MTCVANHILIVAELYCPSQLHLWSILHSSYFATKYLNMIGAEASLNEDNRLLWLGAPTINEYKYS